MTYDEIEDQKRRMQKDPKQHPRKKKKAEVQDTK